MSETVPTISVGAVGKLLEALPALGVDADAVCAIAGFDRSTAGDPQARVPLPRLYAMWEAVLERLNRPDAALLVAERFQPGDYGLLGFVCMTCATLGEAVSHVTRYMLLWSSEPGFRLVDGSTLEVVYHRRLADRPGLRAATEAALAELLNGARILTQQPAFTPKEIWFSHPGPSKAAAHEAFFGCPVRFGQRTTAMRLYPAQLSTPLPRADPQLAAFLAHLAEKALVQATSPSSLIDQVRKYLAAALPKGVPDSKTAARALAMSERTLRRRLGDEGTSFRKVVDDTRTMLAREYLRDVRLPLSEIAFLLGFSEPSAFHRAFRRWFGETPAQFRRSAHR